MKPLITTIITTYKRPKLLQRALKSILRQSFSNFQVCIYDNASGDETGAIIKKYMQHDDRIKYHCHPKNIGMMANYEFALSQVDTPFFTFLSDDDFVFPWFYDTALSSFKQYPDAALTACGVLAVNEKQELVVDPTGLWSREGYFQKPEGLLEMLSYKGKFMIPTGIVFQTEKVKNISPDWASDIQLMWDPDYLIQILAQHPICIQKKICAVFLAHADAFSSSFYYQIKDSPDELESYMKANVKILNRLLEVKTLSSDIKESARLALINMIRSEIITYMRMYIKKDTPQNAIKAANILRKYYGSDKKVFINTLIASFFCLFPFMQKFGLRLFRMIKKLIKKGEKAQIAPEKPLLCYRKYIDAITTH